MAPLARVRPATPKDMPSLVRLSCDLVGFHEALGSQDCSLAPGADAGWRKFLRGHIGREDKMCLIADVNGGIVGFLVGTVLERPGVFMDPGYGYVSDVYVVATHRRRGVREALVEEALRWFGSRRLSRVRLQTDAKNLLGLNFRRSLGFETTVHTMDKLL